MGRTTRRRWGVGVLHLVGVVGVVAGCFLLSTVLASPFSPHECAAHADEADRAAAYEVDYVINEIWGKAGASGFEGGEGERAETYGEVTSTGVRVLSSELWRFGSTDGDCFADVGCGVGRMVAQVALERRGRLELAWGIELVEGRARGGQRAVAELQREEGEVVRGTGTPSSSPHPPPSPPLALARMEIVHGDFATTRLPTCTSHIFLSSLCFSPELIARFVDTISTSLDDADSPLRAVASIKKIPQLGEREGWSEQRVRGVTMSWGSALDVWVYRRGG